MWWLATKKYFKLTAIWCRQHWRWLVLGGVALIMYSLGRKASKAQMLQARLALRSYEQEKILIERAHKKEVEDIKRAQQAYNRALAHVDEQFASETNSLNLKKEQEVRKMIKLAKKDPAEIDRILEEEMGIKRYEDGT